MSSRFDSWVGTAPVKLPIEAYQTSAMVNEQKTQQALDNIGQTIAGYDSISAFGADATAVYDRAMKKLRDNVTAVGNMDLNTPEAKRRFNQVISDRTITTDLKNVMTDSMFAAQRQKELQEYLKKNPSTNTTEYQRAFGAVGRETGDPTKFNPNRFKNMNPLVEFTDVNKMITEGVAKLKQDKDRVKKILGPYYKESEHNGLDEERIRTYVANELATNPLVSEQIERSKENLIYRFDNADRDGGIAKLANLYRINKEGQLQKSIATFTAALKGKTKKQITDSHELLQAQDLLKKAQGLVGSFTDPTNPNYLNNESMVDDTYKNAFINGFSPLAYHEDFNSLTYNEIAKARFDADAAMARLKYKTDVLKQGLTPSVIPFNLPLTQSDPTTHTLKKDIAKVKGLEPLAEFIDDHGGIGIPAPRTLYKTGHMIPSPGGFVSAGFSNEPVTESKDVIKSKYEAGLNALNDYLHTRNLSKRAFNNFATELDVRKALQAVQRFETANEKSWLTSYSTLASTTDAARDQWTTAAHYNGVVDNEGNAATPGEIESIAANLLKTKPAVTITPTLKNNKLNSSYFTTTDANGKVYHAIMDDINNHYMTKARNTMNQGLNNTRGYVANSDNSLNIVEMTPDGGSRALNIPWAAHPDYQKVAKQYWDYNVKRLMNLGYNEKDASFILNEEYGNLHDTLNGNKSATLIVGKGSIDIKVPVKVRNGMYYSEVPLIDGQPDVMNLDQYIYKNVLHFTNPDLNPAITGFSKDEISAKKEEKLTYFNSFE